MFNVAIDNLLNNKKTLIILSVLTVSLTLPLVVLAFNYPVFPEGRDLIYIDVVNMVDSIFAYLWPLFGGLAIIMFIIAGSLFLTAHGDPAKLSLARNSLIWGIIGLAIAILASTIPYIVNTIIFG